VHIAADRGARVVGAISRLVTVDECYDGVAPGAGARVPDIIDRGADEPLNRSHFLRFFLDPRNALIMHVSSLSRRFAARMIFALALAGASSAHAAGEFLTASPGTSDKPQSKIWYNDGSYWAVLQTSAGSHIFQRVAGEWLQRTFIDPEVNHGVDGREDVLWNGTTLYVLVYTGTRCKLYEYSYDPAPDSYALLPGFPVSFNLASGSETVVLDQDSTGRLWVSYEAGGDIYVAWSITADHRTWATPGFVLQTGVNDDDISAVVRFASTRIGVFWSDQNRWEFGFRYHDDADAPEVWSSTEVIYRGTGNSDDHINMAADGNGSLYAITKDVLNEFAVHRRSPSGSWTTKTDISKGQTGTRPVIYVDPASAKLYAAYTCWDCGGSDPIVYRTAPTSTMSFGSGTTLISGSNSMNDVTDMKQVLPPGNFLAIAHGGGAAMVNGWGEPPAGDGFGGGGSWPPPPPPPPPGPPTSPDAMLASRQLGAAPGAEFRFDEAGGDKAIDFLDTAHQATLGASGADTAEPARIEGVSGGGLAFDGINDYVQFADQPEIDFAGSFTLEAWVRRAAPGTADVLIAKEGSGLNYRLRLTPEGKAELAWKNASGTTRTTLGNRILADSDWHHLAAVHDQDRGEDRLYLDGRLDATRADTGRPLPNGDALLLGARKSSSSRKDFLAGELDLVRLSGMARYVGAFTPPNTLQDGERQAYVALRWSAPASGGAATGYEVHRSVNAEPYIVQTPAAVAALEWSDPAPVDGVLRYRIRALNSEGESALSDSTEVTFGTGPRPPQAPPAPAVRVVRTQIPAAGNALFDLDEAAGSTSADRSSNRLTLQLGGTGTGDTAEPLWTTGRSGSGLEFDGVNDYADGGDVVPLRFAGSFTLEAWMRRVETGALGTLLSRESSSVRNYRLAVTSTGKLQLQWKNASDAAQIVTTAGAVSAGVWHHVAAVFDASRAENRLYVDGVLAARAPAAGAPQTGAARFRLGTRASSSLKDFYRGALDQVRASDGALYLENFAPPERYQAEERSRHEITWQAAAPGSAALTGYHVERSVGDGAWERLTATALGLEIRAFTIEETSRDKTCYRVVIGDRLGLASTGDVACAYFKDAEIEMTPAKAEPPARGFEMSVGPNPFNPTTTVRLHLQDAVRVHAVLYDVSGRRVRTLLDGVLPAGEHRAVWDGRDAHGGRAASGIYFLRLQAGNERRTAKLILAQ
jgi:hypothetical protein